MPPLELKSIDDAIEDTGVKMLVYGESGAGKTVLCATTQKVTIILSAEKGLRSLRKYAKKYPQKFEKIKTITIHTIDDLEEAYELFADNVDENQICEWICLDSISEIAEVILASEKEGVNDPRRAYGKMQERIADACRKFRDLRGYNVLFTAKMERYVDGDTNKAMYRPMLPGQNLPQMIPYWFDEVYALRVETEEKDGVKETYRILQTDKDGKYQAKSREGVLDQFETPHIGEIAEKMLAAYAELESEADSEVIEGNFNMSGIGRAVEAEVEDDDDTDPADENQDGNEVEDASQDDAGTADDGEEEEGKELTYELIHSTDIEKLLEFCDDNEIALTGKQRKDVEYVRKAICDKFELAKSADEEQKDPQNTAEEVKNEKKSEGRRQPRKRIAAD